MSSVAVRVEQNVQVVCSSLGGGPKKTFIYRYSEVNSEQLFSYNSLACCNIIAFKTD